jgi:hypothetical protein
MRQPAGGRDSPFPFWFAGLAGSRAKSAVAFILVLRRQVLKKVTINAEVAAVQCVCNRTSLGVDRVERVAWLHARLRSSWWWAGSNRG